jgi:hypothetical protein
MRPYWLVSEVLIFTGWTKDILRQQVDARRFPAPVGRGWLVRDVLAWRKARA